MHDDIESAVEVVYFLVLLDLDHLDVGQHVLLVQTSLCNLPEIDARCGAGNILLVAIDLFSLLAGLDRIS